MDVTITLGWWLLPASFTAATVVFMAWFSREYSYGTTTLVSLIFLIPALAVWAIYLAVT